MPQAQIQATFSRIAERLKNERIKKRLSISKAAKMMKVPESTLEQLEDPEKSKLKPAYSINLYHKYGSLFQLEGQVNKQLETLDKSINTSPKKINKPKKVVVLSSSLRRISLTAIILLLGVYVIYQGSILFLAPRLNIEGDERVISNQSEYVLRGSVARSSILLVNNDPILLERNGEFEHTIYLQEGINLINISASNNLSRETSKTIEIILKSD